MKINLDLDRVVEVGNDFYDGVKHGIREGGTIAIALLSSTVVLLATRNVNEAMKGAYRGVLAGSLFDGLTNVVTKGEYVEGLTELEESR